MRAAGGHGRAAGGRPPAPGRPAILLAAGALSFAAAARPLFLSAASSASLQQGLSGACPWNLGVSASSTVQLLAPGRTDGPGESAGDVFDARQQHVTDAVAGVGHLGEPERTLVFSAASLTRVGGPADRSAFVRLMSRDHARENVQILADNGGSGVLVAASVASQLGLHPGDTARMALGGDRVATLPVAGVYQDLPRTARTTFWCSLKSLVYGGLDPPPPPVLADRPLALRVADQLGDRVTFQWEYPVVTRGLDLTRGRELSSQIDAALTALHKDSLFFRAGSSAASSELGGLTRVARNTSASLGPAVDMLTLAGGALALLVVASAAWFWARSSAEGVTLVEARGTVPARVAVASGVPLVTGSVVGALAAWPLVARVGPSSDIARGATNSAVTAAAIATAIALLACTVGAAVGVRRATVSHPTARPRAVPLPLAAFAAVAAGGAYYELRSGGALRPPGDNGVPQVDRLAVLFPVLLFIAVALAGGFVVPRLVHLVGAVARRLPAPAFLAIRRLEGNPRHLALSFGTACVAVAMVVYGNALYLSTIATAHARARHTVGSDSAYTLPPGEDTAPVPGGSLVHVLEPALLESTSSVNAHLIVVDPATIGNVVYWHDSYGSPSVATVAQALALPPDGGPAPVLVAGGLDGVGTTAQLILGSNHAQPSIPVRIAGQLRGFPTSAMGQPTILVSQAAVPVDRLAGATELWLRGPVTAEVKALGEQDATVQRLHTADAVLDSPANASRRWTAGFILAASAGFGALLVIALVAANVHQRGRRGTWTLLDRMGLTSRAAFVSILVEVALPAATALAAGVGVASWTVRAVFKPLDGAATDPVDPIVTVPGVLIVLVVAGFVSLVLSTAYAAHRVRQTGRAV